MERFVHWMADTDKRLFYLINRRFQCSFLDSVMPRITNLGGAVFSIAVLLACIVASSGEMRQWSIQALLSLTVSHLIVRWIKRSVPRQRPYMTLSDTNTFPNPLTDYSFPSGHTTASFSIASVFALQWPALAFILLPAAFVVGISRIYLGLHYPTDCAMGALLGMGTSWLIVGLG